jgi:hypothetical protein
MVTLLTNIALDATATGGQTGTVGEPSVAASGRTVFLTGNWFACRSADAGASWSPLDPFTELPAPGREFCCDQVVLYSKKHRRWIWFLQYEAGASGANIVRIATSATAAPSTWTWWDLTPTDIDPTWTHMWFDFPDVAETDEHLWVSCNAFRANQWQRSVVVRVPWADVRAGGSLSREMWTSTELSAPRFALGATDTMWFGTGGLGNGELEVFSWADDAASASNWTLHVAPWNAGPYVSNGPGNAPWLKRADDRVTGAWVSHGVVGFAWSASSRPGRPHPYIRCVRIDAATVHVIDEPDLWSPNGAWAYPAIAPNRRGDVGMTAFFGGPTHPAHSVGRFDDASKSWTMTTTATSTHGPSLGKWGDYVTCRAHPTKRTAWIASGFTLNGDSGREAVEPRYIVFK